MVRQASKLPFSMALIRKHGAFEIHREELGLSPKDQTGHYETRIHLGHESTLHVHRERERRRDHSRPRGVKQKGTHSLR